MLRRFSALRKETLLLDLWRVVSEHYKQLAAWPNGKASDYDLHSSRTSEN